MYDIDMQEASQEFARCWNAAGVHIQKMAQGQVPWLKANLHPPFLEHLSFRMGNQLFFVRLEDVEGRLDVPGNRRGVLAIAEGCKGHACIMPMRRKGAEWIADGQGWGLHDVRTGQGIDPVATVSDKLIEITDWELQDFAVQVVKDHLVKQGRTMMSWHGNPSVDPSIWFVGDHGPEWVVVRATRYPKTSVEPPANWRAIAESCSGLGKSGHFASVGVSNADDAFDPAGAVPATPLWRGHGMFVRFMGLVPGPS
ncbi:MAG: hypothetical protein HQ465_13635 [Rhodospirillales bacterium]|nr:hypothetical protein [Rhodospirillales bacterium]